MKAADVYMMHQALKQHFTTKYDYFKYHGRVKVGQNRRKASDHVYTRIAKTLQDKDVQPFLVANMLEDPNQWIGTMIGSDVWPEQKKKLLRLHEVYVKDLKTIIAFCVEHEYTLQQVFESDRNWPIVVKLCQQGYIELETVVILNRIMSFMAEANAKYGDDIIFEAFSDKLKNYDPFVRVNMGRYMKTTTEAFKGAVMTFNL
jgi:hypothetical protein